MIKGPQFLKFFIPILESLKDLGGSGNSSEVIDNVIEKMKISEDELEVTLKNGSSRIKNQIAWARMYLVKAGYIDSSQRGIWSLTDKSLKTEFPNDKEIHSIFKEIHRTYKKSNNIENEIEKNENNINHNEIDKLIEKEIDEKESYKEKLLRILQNISPNGFERLCQRLLRESGFQQVKVTGKSGDGGIDGEGILEINPLVSFKVIFQAKRYKDSVSSPQVRDFRGAMQGRAEKGIIITTGRFTQDAKREAFRDGVPPIELVDGDALVKLFENKNLGLTPKIIYEVDESFFEEFY